MFFGRNTIPNADKKTMQTKILCKSLWLFTDLCYYNIQGLFWLPYSIILT